MAFFPAEVLVELYELLGDARVVMSALAIATEVLLVAAILAGILILMRLYRQRFAVLRALGASRTYVFAVAWTFAFSVIFLGSVLGLGVAMALVGAVSGIFGQATGIAMSAGIGSPEILLALALTAIGAILAILPAALLYRRSVVDALRTA
jgi:putative ABC transport system permease protein